MTIFLATFHERAAQSGKDYQTLINEALRIGLSPESAPLTVEIVLHEELRAAKKQLAFEREQSALNHCGLTRCIGNTINPMYDNVQTASGLEVMLFLSLRRSM